MNKSLVSLKSLLFLSCFFTSAVLIGQGSFILTVNHPDTVAGAYDILQGSFGPDFCSTADLTGDLMFVEDGVGGTEACDTVVNDLTGKIAVLDRGNCDFSLKVFNAQKEGAIAVIVCNNASDPHHSYGTWIGL